MKILLLVLLTASIGYAQNDSLKYSYAMIEFEIVQRDTSIMTVTSGDPNSSDYQKRDSTTVHADIILYYLPVLIDKDSLFAVMTKILTDEGVDYATLWRDKHFLPFKRFGFQSESMHKQWYSSFIGEMKQEEGRLQLGFWQQ